MVTITGYDSNGCPTGITSTLNGQVTTLVDCARYDAAGRLALARYGSSGTCEAGVGGVWAVQKYYPWTGSGGNGNGRYAGVDVGGMVGWTNVLTTTYSYDGYGNPVQYASGRNGGGNSGLLDGSTFSYDDQNRVTYGYGESFAWTNSGRLATLNGAEVTYNAGASTHAMDTINTVDYYDYDLNGNMTVRYKTTGWNQRIKWDVHNRLAEMTGAGVSERYVYDENGQRLRKYNLLSPYNYTTYPFPGYERTSGGAVTKHYSFGGVNVAMRKGSADPILLYGDGLNSTIYTTNRAGAITSWRHYRTWGDKRDDTGGPMPTDRRFTGQQEDATGIYYMNARYYDPQIGQFLSPDTIVPDPSSYLSYNRYLYALGNPLKYNDPSGHIAICFQGGQQREIDPEAAALQMCDAALAQGGYDPEVHGAIYHFAGAGSDIDSAYALALAAAETGEPLVIAGYSWGASAALALADKLNTGELIGVKTDSATLLSMPVYENLHTPIDLLVLIEQEGFWRWIAQPWTSATPPGDVPDNVKQAINLWAPNADGPEWLWANGQNDVENATDLSVDLATHYTIMDLNDQRRLIGGTNLPGVELNPQTLSYFTAAIRSTLASQETTR